MTLDALQRDQQMTKEREALKQLVEAVKGVRAAIPHGETKLADIPVIARMGLDLALVNAKRVLDDSGDGGSVPPPVAGEGIPSQCSAANTEGGRCLLNFDHGGNHAFLVDTWPFQRIRELEAKLEAGGSVPSAAGATPPAGEPVPQSLEAEALATLPECPHDGRCACALMTRHEWHEAYCRLREATKSTAPSLGRDRLAGEQEP